EEVGVYLLRRKPGRERLTRFRRRRVGTLNRRPATAIRDRRNSGRPLDVVVRGPRGGEPDEFPQRLAERAREPDNGVERNRLLPLLDPHHVSRRQPGRVRDAVNRPAVRLPKQTKSLSDVPLAVSAVTKLVSHTTLAWPVESAPG